MQRRAPAPGRPDQTKEAETMEHRTRHPARKRGETTMRKRLFSLCMALALCLGLLPGTALAAD